MTLTYLFNGDEYEFDIGYGEVLDYVESMTPDEAFELVEEGFYMLDKERQHEILKVAEETNFACPDFAKWIEDDISFCVDEIIMEPDNLYRLEDELHDFYEDTAFNQYQDSTMDSYEYNGHTQSDFY